MVKKKSFDATKFQYHPISYTPCAVLYDRIKEKLLEYGYENSPLYVNCENLISHIPNLLEIADKSCCGQIRANGYFSNCKIVFRFFECVENELYSSLSKKELEQEMDYLNKISVLLMRMIEICVLISKETYLEDEETKKRLDEELIKNYPEFYRNLQMFKQVMVKKRLTNISSIDDSVIELKSPIPESSYDEFAINNNSINNSFVDTPNEQEFNSLPLFSPHLSTIFEGINEAIYQPKSPNKHLIFRSKHFMYWIDKDLVSFFKLYVFVLPFLRVRLYRYFQLIFSSDYRSKVLNHILTFPTINFPFEFWNFSDMKISLLFVKYKTRNTKTKSREVFIPSQNSIVINQCPYERITINDEDEIRFENDHKIRCKFIKPKNVDISNCSKLMIHFHGGGFFSQSCDSHEIYLRSWVNYNQIPILTVDYKVKESFPSGLKDCFDIYIWLRMAPEEEIRDKLGFHPKQIVLEGDSAGGNLAFGIVLALNDLRIDYKDKLNLKVQMPDGLVCVYSPFLINTSISSSRVLSGFDTLVPLGIQLIIVKGIAGLIPGLKQNTRLQALKTYLFPFSDPVPWIVCDQDEFRKRLEFTSRMINSPFLTGLFYEKYDSLTDVPLHIISAEYCSFLDEGVTIAKIWKGSIKFDVIPEMCHGFLNLKFVGKNVSNATMFCCQKITEMFNQTDSSRTSQSTIIN